MSYASLEARFLGSPGHGNWCLPLLAVIGALQAVWLFGPALWAIDSQLWTVPPGDSAVGLIGMEGVFRDSWRWPLGDTALLLMGNRPVSIAYTDSLPILAILLKALGFNAESVPPFGLALFLAQVLQPVAAGWALQKAGVKHWTVVIPGALLFACMPPWYFRTWGQHFSLTWHWLIIAALGLAAGWCRSGRISRAEGAAAALLCVIAAGTHAYLATQAATILLSGCLVLVMGRRYVRALALGVSLVVFTAAGAFAVGLLPPPASGLKISLGIGELGFFGFNLLAPFDRAYSALWPAEFPFRATPGQYEGMAYLGAGILLVLVFAIIAMAVRGFAALPQNQDAPALPFYWPLIVVVAGLALFAAYPHLWLGNFKLISLPAPSAATFFFEQFRASGRMIWPAAYLVLLLAVVAVHRLGPRPAGVALTAALAVQVADTATLRGHIRGMIMAERRLPADVIILRDKGMLAGDVRLRPSWGCVGISDGDNGRMLALEAIRAGHRVHQPPMARGATEDCDPAVISGSPPLRGVTDLILRGSVPMKDLAETLSKRDCVVTAGVIACRDRRASGALPISEALGVLMAPSPLEVGVRMPVTHGKVPVELLYSGWSGPEPWGTWSDGPLAQLMLPVPKDRPIKALKLELLCYSARPSKMQGLSMSLSDRVAWQGDLVSGQITTIRVPIEPSDVTSGFAHVKLRIADPQSPKSVGAGNDTRLLGIGLIAIELEGER